MTAADLKEYIRRVYQLESSLYQQQALIGRMRGELRKIESRRDTALERTHAKAEIWSFENIKSAVWILVIPIAIAMTLGSFLCLILAPNDETAGRWAVNCTVASIAIGVILVILYFRRESKKLREANMNIEKENRNAKVQNAQNRDYAARRSTVLHQELQVLERTTAETHRVLNSYYSRNIIFPKYRELVAVSSFYEYLMSGRCSQLEGHGGAYNIFESEVRQNLILRKLDDIIERLDRIEDNQYMLYSTIQNSNRDTSRLLGELNRTAQSIESNTAITAYNSGITAQNTECLKWLTVLRA